MSQVIGDNRSGLDARPCRRPTSKARLVTTALFVDHQTPSEVAARYGIHRAWVYKLKALYEAEGETALEPRSRRPKTSPAALSAEVVDLIVRICKELTDAGLDAGPEVPASGNPAILQVRGLTSSRLSESTTRRGQAPKCHKRDRAAARRHFASRGAQA